MQSDTEQPRTRRGGWDRRVAASLVWLRGRFGLLWIVYAALLVFGASGISKISFDDELLNFFESELPAYLDFVEVAQNFGSDSNDLIILVEAEDVADPKVLTAVSDFLLEAQFSDWVRAAFSPLSLTVTEADGSESPLVPFPALPRDEMAARFDAAFADDPALSRLMAEDRSALIMVMPVKSFGPGERDQRIAEFDQIAAHAAAAEAASGARFRLSGYVVLRDAVARALLRDTILLNTIGLLVGFVVAMIALRSVSLAALTLPGPTSAVIVALGVFGHFGVPVNAVTLVLPMLALVLGASDSIHISFERARQQGRDGARAGLRAVRRVAVACIFAAATTSVAFAALALSSADVIAQMGTAGAFITLLSVLVVLLAQALALTWAGRFAWFQVAFDRLAQRKRGGRFGFSRLPTIALVRPRLVAWGGLGLLVVTTILYSQAGPRYSLLDSLHDDAPVLRTFQDIEAKVTPVSLLQIPVESTDPKVLAKVESAVMRIAAEIPDVRIGTVESVGRLAATGAAVADLPEVLKERLVSEDGTMALVNLPFDYETGSQAIALADAIDIGLAADPALDGIGIWHASGLPLMSARVAGTVLGEINRSLLIALVAVILLILIWLRNLRVALLSLIPNALPVTVIGAGLMLSGRGIEFSNGLGLTVAFGIAVDDTLHVLNRLRLSGGVESIERRRLAAALREVTPALVTTSAVLIFGVAGTFLADSKAVTDFGKIAMSVYLLALIADLLVLPACLAVFGPRSYLRDRRHRT